MSGQRRGGIAIVLAAYGLLFGEETPLTRLIDGLYALASTARQDPAIAALMADPSPDVVDQVDALPQAIDLRKQLDRFLDI